jgi:hypothetical protein
MPCDQCGVFGAPLLPPAMTQNLNIRSYIEYALFVLRWTEPSRPGEGGERLRMSTTKEGVRLERPV